MLNNDCKYVNMIITKLKKTLPLTFQPDNDRHQHVLFFKEVHKNSSYDTCYYTYKIQCMHIYLRICINYCIRIENSSQLTSCIYLFAVWSNLHSFCPQTFVEFSYKSGLGNSYSTSNLQQIQHINRNYCLKGSTI